ncbi:MAG: restriction endonuclease subunit S [Bryobacterales bacterium]|nr:restriction endonuclease subunit S [Bryobacterales bacterium]
MKTACELQHDSAGKLEPYSAYKASGVEWLGDMPEHWTVKRGKALFHCVDVRSSTGEEELLTVSSERGVIPRSSATVTMFKAESYAGYKLCWPGDLVVNSLWAWACGLGVSRHHGIISSAYGVYRLRPPYTNYSAYVHELVRSTPFNWELRIRSKGIWISRLQLTDEAFLGAPFPLPPLPEQTAIVRYLDHVDRRIQRYIRAKQKLIALLEEQKQAVIHQAVTGRIDVRTGRPYPAYKDSGVEWLGDVPEHWEVVPLRRVAFDYCDGPFGSGLKSSHYTEGGVRVVRLQNIGHGEFRNSDAAFISPEYYSSLGDHSVEEGDILIAGLGDDNHPAGRACVAPASILPAMVKADCFRFRLNQTRVVPRFIALQLTATATVASALLSTGATRQRTNLQNTSARAISFSAVPEQVLIVEHIIAKTSGISAAVKSAKREIDLLREYRTRLIADVVTGKIDVRMAAAPQSVT